MAARPANQTSGSGTVPVKVKGGGKPKTAQARWNANKGHTKSYADHIAAVKARGTGGTPAGPVQDLTTPPSYAQALQEANAAGDAQYGPQVTAARQQQANVKPWFEDYKARVAGYALAAQQAAKPILDQAQTLAAPATDPAAAAAQLPAGLDPNSDAGKAATLAAQGRAALAQLGQQALSTNATATQDYFTGESNAAAKQLPQAQQAAAQNLASAEGQRGAAVTTYLTGARQNAQNYQIAQGTLAGNTANQQADNAIQAAGVTQAAKDKRAARVVTKRGQDISAKNQADRTAAAGKKPNQYGVPAAQWDSWSTSHRQRVMDAQKAKGTKPVDPATQQAKDFYDKYGVKPATTSAVGRARDSIEAAKATANLIRKSNPKLSREDIAQVLLHGQPAQKDGSPALPKTSPLWASVVLDIVLNGAISKQTGDRLHAAGYEAHQLGVPVAAGGPSPKPPKLNTGGSLGGFPGSG